MYILALMAVSGPLLRLARRSAERDKAAFWPVQSNGTFSKTARVNLKTAPSWFFDADRLRFA